MNIILIAYMITMGLEQAACTLIGHQIGDGNIPKAKAIYQGLLQVSAFMLITTSFGLYLAKEHIISLLT